VEHVVWEIIVVSAVVTVGIIAVSALAAAAVSFIDERFFSPSRATYLIGALVGAGRRHREFVAKDPEAQ
jgi:hypothetical protein